jgi:PAS domain S-box-containing protein
LSGVAGNGATGGLGGLGGAVHRRWRLTAGVRDRVVDLPGPGWASRHRFVLAATWLAVALVGVVGAATGSAWSDGVWPAAWLVPVAVAATVPTTRRARTVAAAVVLTGAAASVAYLAEGSGTGVFVLLLALAVLWAYRSWLPFAVALVTVPAFHFVVDVVLGSGHDHWDEAVAELAIVVAACTARLVNELAQLDVDRLRLQHLLVLDAVEEGICGADLEGRGTFVNGACTRILGYSEEEIVGRSVHELTHHHRADGRPYPASECPIRQAVARGTRIHVTGEVFWRPDGTSFPVEYVAAPLRQGGRVVGGVVTFRDVSEQEEARRAATELAALVEREAATTETVHLLEEAVRPPVPEVEHAELGVHVLPADPDTPTGGDLYDLHVLPDGDLHFAVVDVVGKGVAATKDALAVIHALRLLVLDGCEQRDLVRRTDELVTALSPDLVATALVARYTPSTGVVRLAGAGHPPALVVSPDGSSRFVPAPGIPIGWPGAGSDEVVEVKLARSEVLLLYTDGLVEATKDILAGFDALERAAAETVSYPARSLARALVERALSGGVRRDDTLALVLRRREQPVLPEQLALRPLEHWFSPHTVSVPLARHLLEDWLRNQPVDPACVADVVLMASELCSNAVAASSGSPRSLALRAWIAGGDVVVEVSDDGPGISLPDRPDDDPPDAALERGRGLYIVRVLADEVATVVEDGGRTAVRAVKRSVAAAGPRR